MPAILQNEEGVLFQNGHHVNADGGLLADEDNMFFATHEGSQKHTYARGGDDIIEMHFERDYVDVFEQGNHIRGDIVRAVFADGYSNSVVTPDDPRNSVDIHDPVNMEFGFDQYIFSDTHRAIGTTSVIGRFEDFDFSRDQLFLDPENIGSLDDANNALDFYNLPSNVSVVRYNGLFNDYDDDPQLWIRIITDGGGVMFYALEGARVDTNGDGQSNRYLGNGYDWVNQEAHFLPPNHISHSEILALQAVDFVDPMNYVPQWYEDLFPERRTYQDVDARYQQVGENEKIVGTNAAEGISGGLNDDYIKGMSGGDHIWGGSGHDTIYGGYGNDHLWGNSGRDLIKGGNGQDIIDGGLGDDILYGDTSETGTPGGNNDDVIEGGDGNDKLFGGAGNDQLNGGDGDDYLAGNAGDNLLTGGLGSDTFAFSSQTTGTDTITDFDMNSDILMLDGTQVTWGDSSISVSGGDKGQPLSIQLGSHTVLLEGIAFGDWQLTQQDPDPKPEPEPEPEPQEMTVFAGTAGDDILSGTNGAEEFRGFEGNDSVYGKSGNDVVYGDAGNDILRGNGGADELRGGSGDDRLIGHWGDDVLIGGTGKDVLSGGDGADRFIFRETDVAVTAWNDDSAIDMILDLDRSRDTIRLDYADTSQDVATYFGVWANQTMDYDGTTYSGVLLNMRGADGVGDNQFIFIAGDHTKAELVEIVEIV